MMRSVYIALKDIRSAVRSRFALGMMVVIPLLVPGIFYVAFGGLGRSGGATGMAAVKVAVVNLDRPGPGVQAFGRMAANFLSSPQLSSFIAATEYPDEASASAVVRKGQAAVAVILPDSFSAAVMGSRPAAEVRLLTDPARTVSPRIVQAVVGQFLDGLSGGRVLAALAGQAGRAADLPKLIPEYQQAAMGLGQHQGVAARAPGQAEDNSVEVKQIMARVMAGLMVFFVFYTAAYMATSILREDEDGTLQRLFAAPVERSGILGGKLLSVFVTITVQALVLIVAARVLFGTTWGVVPSAGLALVGMVVSAGGFGIMLASFMKNVRQSGPVLGGGLSVAGMLGGLFTPAVPNMPAILGKVALVFPQGWVMRAWTSSVSGQGPADVVVPFLVMIALGVVCFSIGVLVFRRRFA